MAGAANITWLLNVVEAAEGRGPRRRAAMSPGEPAATIGTAGGTLPRVSLSAARVSCSVIGAGEPRRSGA